MKKFTILASFILIGASLVGCNQVVGQADSSQNGKQLTAQNCLADECLLFDDLEYPAGELPEEVIDALDLAIEDEYKAKTTYEKVVEEFGSVRPFIMIIGAEESHIASLKSIYDKYGLEVPENTWANEITAPETLQLACQTGVDAEIENARLYEEDLIPAVSEYEDIIFVFENLMEASETKHLPAFEKCN